MSIEMIHNNAKILYQYIEKYENLINQINKLQSEIKMGVKKEAIENKKKELQNTLLIIRETKSSIVKLLIYLQKLVNQDLAKNVRN